MRVSLTIYSVENITSHNYSACYFVLALSHNQLQNSLTILAPNSAVDKIRFSLILCKTGPKHKTLCKYSLGYT